MPLLHVFNPSHDEALAANTPYYTPTAAARRLAADLDTLPTVWAAPDDCVWLADGSALTTNGQRRQLADAVAGGLAGVVPWGWDAHIAKRLHDAGVPDTLLPSQSALAIIRQLSSRATAVGLLADVRADAGEHTVGRSRWCVTATDVAQAMADFGPQVVVKAPWSCSGRGVFRVGPDDAVKAWPRIGRLLDRQGAVEVEPFYHGVRDCAMEFTAGADGSVTYDGLSVFTTSPAGGYGGNIIATEPLLRTVLPQSLHAVLDTVRDSLGKRLETLLAGRYAGPLGVDMMVIRRASGELALHPCIEVNLRRTMGHVALSLRRRLAAPGDAAFFTLAPNTDGHLAIQLAPVRITDGDIHFSKQGSGTVTNTQMQ